MISTGNTKKLSTTKTQRTNSDAMVEGQIKQYEFGTKSNTYNMYYIYIYLLNKNTFGV